MFANIFPTIRKYPNTTFIVVGALVFFPLLGNLHLFDWEKANISELAREMITNRKYLHQQINYLPFYEKPALFICFQVLSMKLFGINEFAVLFPNALLVIITMLSLYQIRKRTLKEAFGYIWTWVYVGSLLPFLYFRTGLIDPWINYFMFLALFFYCHFFSQKKWISLGWSARSLGLGAMILVNVSLGLAWIASRFKIWLKFLPSMLWFALGKSFSCLLFAYETFAKGKSYLREFVLYQIRLFTTEDAFHRGPFYYHAIVLLFGYFLDSYVLFSNKTIQSVWAHTIGEIMILCGFWILVLFSIVHTKIIHYSFLDYLPNTFFWRMAHLKGKKF